MVGGHGLLRIFWPSDTPRSKEQGTIVGWRTSELDVFVVSVLQNVEVQCLSYIRVSDILICEYSHVMSRAVCVLVCCSAIVNIPLSGCSNDVANLQCTCLA